MHSTPASHANLLETAPAQRSQHLANLERLPQSQTRTEKRIDQLAQARTEKKLSNLIAMVWEMRDT